MSQKLYPHRRFNPLLNEWILVSPQRASRPWLGQTESEALENRPEYDKECYLCPGNTRANGEVNPQYTNTFIFTNDFQAILPKSSLKRGQTQLFHEEPVRGTCRVVCFSPKHNLTLAEMNIDEIASVITTWKNQMRDLGKTYAWAQIFENKGAIMGCSNPHPHGQVWASNTIPALVAKEDEGQKKYFKKTQAFMLQDYAQEELKKGERIVYENDDWIIVVPYWAVWPFETMILPKKNTSSLLEISSDQQITLANALKNILVRYDNLFKTSFPYSMGIHCAPLDGKNYNYWQFHIHFYPPLLRSSKIKKFLVGYEMLAEPQRDMSAEQAAARLRETSSVHYNHENEQK